MLKSQKKLISALTAAVVTIAAVFGTAVSAAAATATPFVFTKDTKAISVYAGYGIGYEESKQAQSFIFINDGFGGDDFRGANYIVYYVNRNDATGVFGNWTTALTRMEARGRTPYGIGVGLDIPNPAKGTTTYITVLPYTDTPSRQYGQFSPYATIQG